MDIGEHPAGNRGEIYILTNCDSVKMYKDDIFIKEYTKDDSTYKNMIAPPILIDDFIGDQMKAMTRYKMKFDDAYMLFGKYIGNWGGKVTKFRFDGIKNGEVVKTVIKSAMTESKLIVDVSSNELIEDATYDVTAIRIKVTDENGNVLSFYNKPAVIETSGPVEILGPALADINGGMGGVYIRSTGISGKASVKITLPDQNLTSVVELDVRAGK